MLISELNHLEVVSEAANVAGGTGRPPVRTYFEKDVVKVDFSTDNEFKTDINTHLNYDYNTSSFGAKSDVVNPYGSHYPIDSFNKADGLAVVYYGQGGFAVATGTAAAKPMS